MWSIFQWNKISFYIKYTGICIFSDWFKLKLILIPVSYLNTALVNYIFYVLLFEYNFILKKTVRIFLA